MKKFLMGVAMAGLLAACADGGMMAEKKDMAAMSEAHAHMGHVSTAWTDTPDGMGFLPTAVKEAEIAAYHAEVAASKPGDLAWMKEHALHVAHAVDPSVINQGPGLGYGVKAAAMGAAKHIRVAAGTGDASENVKLHAEHVGASSDNAVMWSDMIVDTVRQIQATTTAEQAAPITQRLAVQSKALLEGVDANNDGKVTWEPGEGGLNEASKHMGFMEKGEGMS